MNILFVGPYKQFDEWGRKSRSLLSALKRTGNLVTSRPIFFGNNVVGDYYKEESEYAACDAYDAVIQCTLPSFAVYDGKFKKNIGFFNTDTIDTSPFSASLGPMEMLDEIWVENKDICENLKNQVNTTRVSLIKPYLDTSLDQFVAEGAQRYPNGILRGSQFHDKFIFYAIGSLAQTEGCEELMLSYLSEFSASDNCVLIYALETPIASNEVNKFVEDCFKQLGAIRTQEQRPSVHFMNPDAPIPPHARVTMHNDGDCFICPDYSLNCNTLILEAVSAQSTPIINKNTAAYHLLGEDNSWGVESYEENCILSHRSFDDMYTCKETCVRPIVKSLAQNMREAYTNKLLREKKRDKNIETTQLINSDTYYDSLKDLLCSH